MSDFSTGRVNPTTGLIVYADDNDSLGITVPLGTTSSTPTVQAIGVIQGFNLGDGIGIFTTFEASSRNISGFKSLVAGSGVVLSTDDQTITINSNFTNVLAQLSFETVGTGASLYKQKIAGDVQLRSIVGGGIVAVQQSDDSLIVSANAVTSIGLNGTADILVNNSPVTSTGTIGVALSDTGVQAGTYTNASLTIDSKGRVTAASTVAQTPITVQVGPGLTVTPGPNYTVGLTSTSVAAGTYTAPSLIIDGTGRITSAASNTIPGPVSAQTLGSGAQLLQGVSNQQLSFRSIVGAGAITVTQDDQTVTISAPTSGTVTSINATGSNGILVSGGPISTSGSLTVALADTAVTPGTYTAPTITVDQTGRITSATSNTYTGEANTTSNLAGGYGLAAAKNGVDLPFKSLVAGPGVTLSATTNTVVISSSSQDTPWTFVTSAATAAPFERVAANTMGGSFTLTLPSAPTDGCMVVIRDLAGNFAVNSLGLASASPMLAAPNTVTLSTALAGTCSTAYANIMAVYSQSVDRWYIVQA